MRVLAERLKVVSSSNVTPSDEPGPVASVSFLKTRSPICRGVAVAGSPRVTVAPPCKVAT
jgi:hypothetical protein